MNEPLRVIMFPGRGNPKENRYIDLLVNGLRTSGIKVVNWEKDIGFQRGDIFHVHWPEVIAHIRRRRWQWLRGWWIERQLWRTIARVKRGGGRLMWTAHNIRPHDARLQNEPGLERLFTRFYGEVDGTICLTKSAIEIVRRDVPALSGTTFYLGRHPHYRSVLPPPKYNPSERGALGASQKQYLFGFLGSMRMNKNPAALARAFSRLEDDYFLVMFGAASAEVQADLRKFLSEANNSALDFSHVTESRMISLYSALDALVFPGADYFNSGTIYTALSLNVPVVAAWSPVNAEIQELVGSKWLYLFRGELSDTVLRSARLALTSRRDDQTCDMQAFDPALCATQHCEAYRDSLTRPLRSRQE